MRYIFLLLLAAAVAGQQQQGAAAAAPRAPAAAGTYDCPDPHVLSGPTCDRDECRLEVGSALIALWRGLSGDANAWRDIPADDMCLPCRWSPAAGPVAAAAVNATWLPSYCCWPGVYCCSEEARTRATASEADPEACSSDLLSVHALALRQFDLTGRLGERTVMASLEQLARRGLHALDLSSNAISGSIPRRIGRLKHLTAINLNLNRLTGTLPTELADLTKLELFYASFNNITGTVMGRFCQQQSSPLKVLVLRGNQLTGQVDMQGCTAMEILDFQDNKLVGSLPIGAGNRNLISLRATNNQLSGSISEDIWRLPQLVTIDIANNRLTGTISDYCGSTNNLVNLFLGNNSLSGTLPGNLTSNSQLLVLELYGNRWLSGTFPDSKSMVGIRKLDLHRTAISGRIPDVWGHLPYLELVDISDTHMACCSNQSEADELAAHSANALLPDFLAFSTTTAAIITQRTQPMGRLVSEEEPHQDTNTTLFCRTVVRKQDSPAVWNIFHLPVTNDAVKQQRWVIDPTYTFFKGCGCPEGTTRNGDERVHPAGWCVAAHTNSSVNNSGILPPPVCTAMAAPVCEEKNQRLSAKEKAAVIVGICIAFVLLLLLANQLLARAGKLRRYYMRLKMQLKGAPKHGKMSIVITDIEGYSDIFKRAPEVMFRALVQHNSVIRAAKYSNCGFILEQEGDSFVLAFYEAFDAVAFCLQIQQALLLVDWPPGLDLDRDGRTLSSDDQSIVSRKTSKLHMRLSHLVPGNRKKLPGRSCTASITSVMEQPQQQTLSGTSHHHLGSRLATLSTRLPQGQAPLFAGLRVRVGVVSGEVPSGTPLKSSALFQLAKVVSDFGSGGQVIIDHTTFASVKEKLRELGAVEAGGLNFGRLSSGRSLVSRCLAALGCSRQQGAAEEAVVLDMGAWCAGLAADQELPFGTTLPDADPDSSRPAAAAAAPASQRTDSDTSSSGCNGCCGRLFAGGRTASMSSDTLNDGCVVAGRKALQGPGSSSSNGAAPAAAAAAAGGDVQSAVLRPGMSEQQLSLRFSKSTSLESSATHQSSSFKRLRSLTNAALAASHLLRSMGQHSGVSRADSVRRREWQNVRIYQVLAPPLVQRAHAWHSSLPGLPQEWCCYDMPYFDAPGSTVAPLASSGGLEVGSSGVSASVPAAGLLRPPGSSDCAAATQASCGSRPASDGDGPAPAVSVMTGALHSLQQHLHPLLQPLPPMTMVFMAVENPEQLVKRRRSFAPQVTALLNRVVRQALRRTGGYLCRVQEGDLRFMVAFASPVVALEWCLCVQEAAMYLPWPTEPVLLYDGCKLQRDERNRIVFRGPRLKMGVCEGCPSSILPDHEGRADYHGPSVNMAARFMGQAALGGQTACTLQLAEKAMAHWGQAGCAQLSHGFSGSGSSTGLMADTAACADSGTSAAAACSEPGPCRSHSAVAAGRPGLSPLQQQQWQQRRPLSDSGVVGSPVGSPPDASPFSALMLAEAGQRPGGWFRSSSQLMTPGCQLDSIGSGQQLDARFGQPPPPWAAAGVPGSGSSTQQQQQQGMVAPPPLRLPSQRFSDMSSSAGAQHLPQKTQQQQPVEQQPSRFVLVDAPRAPAQVEVHRLGTYAFKGGPPQQEMVQVLLAHLTGRLTRTSAPKQATSRKGQQLQKLDGRVGAPVTVQLPTLAQELKERLPDRLLNGGSSRGATARTPARHAVSYSFSNSAATLAAAAAAAAGGKQLAECRSAPEQPLEQHGSAEAAAAVVVAAEGVGVCQGASLVSISSIHDAVSRQQHQQHHQQLVAPSPGADAPSSCSKQRAPAAGDNAHTAAASGSGASSFVSHRHDSFRSVASEGRDEEEGAGSAVAAAAAKAGSASPSVEAAWLLQQQQQQQL